MAAVCAQCRMPVRPVNECICDDGDEPGEYGIDGEDDG